MRLVATSQDRKKSVVLAEYLTSQGIENQLEMFNENDWGNDDYGIPTFHIWVVSEEEFEKARNIANVFFTNPEDLKYQVESFTDKINLEPSHLIEEEKPSPVTKKKLTRPIPWGKEPIGFMTLYLIIGCCLLFFITESTAPTFKEPIASPLPPIPIYYSKIKKDLLFDYPAAYSIIDKMANAYGVESFNDLNDLPKEEASLLKQFYQTPYWTGYYDEAIRYLKQPEAYQPSKATLFEKIREGEFWRLFTPSLMHADILHILFNMMWLAVLGRQLEQRMGRWRYLIFILITGVITNIVQYLTGGSNFLGFSAILCAMLTFVWVRQRRFAWEGYQLDRSTFGFMMFFLFTMLAFQLTSFYTEVSFGQAIAPPIANSAHMSGLVLGYLLGHLNFFAWK